MNRALILIMVLSLFSCGKKTAIDDSKPVTPPTNNGGNQDQEWTSPLKVASYNIEYDNASNTDNAWINRKNLVKQMFEKYNLDIVGVQEPYLNQLNDMLTLLPSYGYVGTDVRGTNNTQKQLSVTIFYNKSRIEIQKWGTFWLSETPEIAGIGWDAFSWRICTWAFAKDKTTNKEFYFFNTHLDHVGVNARTNAVKQLLATIPEMAKGYPAIITGDFNSNQNQSYYKLMVAGNDVKDTYDLTTNKTNALRGTYNNYNVNTSDNNRIDHIFLTTEKPIKVNSWAIRTDLFENKYPSDHFPVIAELSFSKK